MGRPAVDSSNRHLASARGVSQGHSGSVRRVTGKGGTTVMRLGPTFAEPVHAIKENPVPGLIAELEEQKRAREST